MADHFAEVTRDGRFYGTLFLALTSNVYFLNSGFKRYSFLKILAAIVNSTQSFPVGVYIVMGSSLPQMLFN